MYNKAILDVKPLGFMWDTRDPFLFCVHHHDAYPPGNDEFGPDAPLDGRNLGQDFTLKDGWRMYHGEIVPGFPAHPHRGFETVTVVLEGFVDHSDSHGAAGRYGNGDVQWMTAGSGLQHSEMFPLLNRGKGNPLELFQIWLNLPAKDKFAPPHYKMLWAHEIPKVAYNDSKGNRTEVTLIAGAFGGQMAPAPAPHSWAANPANEVAIWIIRMDPGAQFTLPAVAPEVYRTLYFYEGSTITVAGLEIKKHHAAGLLAEMDIVIESGQQEACMLLLQGKPIAEPVSQYGPFVMNTHVEIQQAISDYRKTQFGGWPWPRHDQVHGSNPARFAKYSDGKLEKP
ncbi:MAG TPA: pirin family protein [Bacteroidales bacterium]|nr:pirin family protein [Bacteroidales bacterium]